jgi:sugar (pentulose or hexulose) kinase
VWNPTAGCFSSLAVSRGWATLFAPLRSAWEVLGVVGAERAEAWGLPADCQVHVGVHDSNACLARYLQVPAGQGAASEIPEALTIVSSGTWTVLMAPGAPSESLHAEQDMLGNVDVTGRMTPTARFMGGREFVVLLDGASPAGATLQSVQGMLDTATLAIPAFSQHGGPFAGRAGYVLRHGQRLQGALSTHLSESERAALAALYCAQVTAWLVTQLWHTTDTAKGRVVVEGPLASNPVYMQLLQLLLPHCMCYASSDDVEGTARGAWMLAHWGATPQSATLTAAGVGHLQGLDLYQQQWLDALN